MYVFMYDVCMHVNILIFSTEFPKFRMYVCIELIYNTVETNFNVCMYICMYVCMYACMSS
jgi:hypothetical protein